MAQMTSLTKDEVEEVMGILAARLTPQILALVIETLDEKWTETKDPLAEDMAAMLAAALMHKVDDNELEINFLVCARSIARRIRHEDLAHKI